MVTDTVAAYVLLSMLGGFVMFCLFMAFREPFKAWSKRPTTKPPKPATLDDLAKMVRHATARQRVAEMPANLFVAPQLRLSSLDRPITPLEPALIDHQQFLVELGRRQAMDAFNQAARGRMLQH